MEVCMIKVFNVDIEKDVIDKFNTALTLNSEEKNAVIERLMADYIFDSFSRISKQYKQSISSERIMKKDVFYGKAISRVPLWAARPHQYNHRIIKAFFQIESELGYVPYFVMEKRCTNKDKYPDIYVPKFKGNFDQMKADTPKSHGKVFEIEKDNVVLWNYTKSTLLEYKNNFL